MVIKLTASEEIKEVAQNLLNHKFKINVLKLEEHETVNIPVDLANFVEQIIREVAEGNSITLVSNHQEISTTEASEILEVSRQHLIELLESGELPIPFRRVGKHRRLRAEDVINYKNKIDEQRLKTLEELAKQAQELKLGYE
ncbi:helix-turn-helix domain-containing protein [Cyanobacterium aponinum UTEX 3222]|uniref:DNA binding domain protein, excisionase family n=1 Tax=Cyanobacterium aponinum (strain PCC 10605) TaxID=755178 RepID=K9Z7L0_CYAAP|nr:helix-turn-helix domain-containing protein [Cyanobacterium aponinum]AFZ54702.1 DNA binding domain protein, excisionase family [Cyanobacterium aponinum PCC 10605]WRL36982.1 helix-turn-helix domain-containing protein [Cyanobacterium aponinum UTEX 3221]WRL43314.1 helix-turn-helix domain-containing protein [Cyanobacterium aponinum UTEX 3222]